MRLDYDLWKEYAAEGAWADLTDYVTDEYTDLNNYVGEYWTYARQNGRIMGVPSLSGTPSNHVVAIRQDWLNKLNLEVPKTLDDYITVMRAFTNDDPDGDGEKNTYGMGGSGTGTLSPLFGAYGASPARVILPQRGWHHHHQRDQRRLQAGSEDHPRPVRGRPDPIPKCSPAPTTDAEQVVPRRDGHHVRSLEPRRQRLSPL